MKSIWLSALASAGLLTLSGATLAADLIVLATGFKGQEHLVCKLLGDDVAARLGPIWGFGDDQELRNMFVRTAQPGLWFIAGSFAQCRIYSKYLGLQIKACEAGLLPRLRALSDAPGIFGLAKSGRVIVLNSRELKHISKGDVT